MVNFSKILGTDRTQKLNKQNFKFLTSALRSTNSGHLLCKFSKVAQYLNYIQDFRHWIARTVSVLSLFRSGVTVCSSEENFLSTGIDVDGIARKSNAILCQMGNVFLLLLHHLSTSVASLTGV